MITPIRSLSMKDICKRENDLLVSADDIKELAKNERIKAIDDFFKKIMQHCSMSNMNATMIRQIAEQLKAGVADE